MANKPSYPEQHFSLASMLGPLGGHMPPAVPFDQTGEWRNVYDLYTTGTTRAGANGGSRVGALDIRRTPTDAGARLEIEYTKTMLTNHVQHTTATMDCADDALATPSAWQWKSKVKKGEMPAWEELTLANSARCVGNAVTITSGTHARRLPGDGPWALNWVLFDAVQRLPRKPGAPLLFTLIDHFDQVKPRHSLAFRKTVDLTIGATESFKHVPRKLEKGTVFEPVREKQGGEVQRFHVFEQLGTGIVPIVYWLNAHGRLVVVSSGLEVYVLRSTRKA